jgi:hypothetical protein
MVFLEYTLQEGGNEFGSELSCITRTSASDEEETSPLVIEPKM